MDYLLCIPARETNTRENCEKIHNVLARMSDIYKLRIVPEPVKNKQFPCPPYYKKYRIYKQVKERDANGEAYLEKEEEDMIISSCKTEEEQELMKSCIYAYQYSASLVLKSFREKEKKNKMSNRAASEKIQVSDDTETSNGSAPALKPENRVREKSAGEYETTGGGTEEKYNQESEGQEGGGRERENRERIVRERDNRERIVREREIKERGNRDRAGREKAVRDRDIRESGNRDRVSRERVVRERENRERIVRGRDVRSQTTRERDSRENIMTEHKKVNQTPIARTEDRSERVSLPFRALEDKGGAPTFREGVQPVKAQPLQRKKDSYKPLERKPALPSQSHEA